MGQAEIIELLRQNYPRWLTPVELIKLTGQGSNVVYRSLKSIRNREEVEIKYEESKHNNKLFISSYRFKKED